jgi:phage terminase small subunit
MLPDSLALDRALAKLARDARGHRDAVIAALLDEGPDGSMTPRDPALRTVGDLRRLGPAGLLARPTMRALSADAVTWLLAAIDAGEAPDPAAPDAGVAQAPIPPAAPPAPQAEPLLEAAPAAVAGEAPPAASDAAPRAYDRLSSKHRVFVDAYLDWPNAAAAARAAGYSHASAHSYGYKLRRRADIRAVLGEREAPEPASEPVARSTPKSPYQRLRPKHRAFLDAYRRHWNATRAALAAGYAACNARQHGSGLLKRPDIRAALIDIQEQAAMANEAEISEVVAILTRMLRANPLDYVSKGADGRHYLDIDRLTPEQAAVISKWTMGTRKGDVRFNHDKLAAADKLLRYHGAIKPEREANAATVEAPAPKKPITNRDRANALLEILARAEEEAEAEAAAAKRTETEEGKPSSAGSSSPAASS